jgi:RNA polymerase sigma factor (sigma-70 family)
VKLTDAQLLKGLISGDEEVVRQFYRLFFQSIRRFVLYNGGTDEDAKDLFQEVLLVMFQKARKGNFTLTSSLGTYLYSVSRFLWLKELGKRKRFLRKSIDVDEFIDIYTDIGIQSEYNERMLVYKKCFEKLSADCQKVLTLFMEGRSITEITKIMGYSSEQHTKNRRYRCKLSLINKIKEES